MPQPLPEVHATAADRAECRAMIRAGSKSFAAASLLLPPKLRTSAYALYAFCRLSDDLVDVEGGSLPAIVQLRARLQRAYAGRPADSAVDRAFADVVAAYGMPRALPEALIDGLEWDVAGVACETLSDVYAYGARVAGSVGAMMAVLMGVRDEARLARACDLGVAMQLTNIARDVGEDARNGRLYLPRAWLREEGLDPDAWLAAPAFGREIAAVVARLLAAADALYVRADAGIARLPARCRPGIFAARRLYCAIGREVARRGFDSVSGRARVNGRGKLAIVARAVGDAALVRGKNAGAPALAETQYLVQAVADAPAPNVRGVSDRIVWVAELFAEMELRRRTS
jgi:phytoene synthase